MIWQVTRFLTSSVIIMRILLQPGNLENYLVTHLYKEWLVRFLRHTDNCFNAQELCFIQSYPLALPVDLLKQQQIKITEIQTRKFQNIMKNRHRNEYSIFILSQHSLLIKQCKILFTNATIRCNKVLLKLIMFTLAIPTTVFNYPIYSDDISCHVFLYTPQVPASPSAQAVSSCHNL